MLKISIWPSFINKSLFELKNDTGIWTLLITKEAFGEGEFKDSGNIWTNNELDAVLAEQLISNCKEIIINPESDLRVISDGIQVNLRLIEDNVELSGEFRTPIPGSKEQLFVFDLIELTKSSIEDIECLDYLELIEQYFFEVSPIKEFDDANYRLKIVGGLSISDKSELQSKFRTLVKKKNPIIDMSNFFSSARALDECFLAIEDTNGLTVIANKHARSYLWEIGFDSKKIKTPHNNT